jgi:hypothetical protein
VFSSFCFFNYTKSFSQCDEYFINALILGPKESVYQQGSPMRFCPKLRGISLDGYNMDVYQWNGYDPQYITVKKDGGIAGTLVLSIKERELSINLIGSPGVQVYSISLNEEEYNDFLIKEQQKQTQIAEAKNRIREKINSLQVEEAANIYEGNWLEDKQLFDEIQTKILAIPTNKQLDDSEAFNLLISTKPAAERFLTLSQGSFTLSSDTISGVTLTDNSSGQKFVIDNKAMIIKYGKFDRVNQFQKTLEIKKSKTLHGVKLNPKWNGNLSSSGITMRFFKAEKKGKTIILGGVSDNPPSKYSNVEVVPGLLENVSFDEKLELKKGKFIYLNKIIINGVEKINIALEDKETLDLVWFYF